MKRFTLTEDERRTLLEMGLRHPHPRVRRRAQALVRLAQGITRTRLAQEFGVHLNSVRAWVLRWQRDGVVGLREEQHEGRPRKLSEAAARLLREIAGSEGGSIAKIMRRMECERMPLDVRPETVGRWLKEMGLGRRRRRGGPWNHAARGATHGSTLGAANFDLGE
jgi:transposase